jgi:hypothetical protein
LREQNALSEEIVQAITSGAMPDAYEDEDLEAELEQMQQEQLDEQMLNTGTMPVADVVHRMPTAANGERKSTNCLPSTPFLSLPYFLYTSFLLPHLMPTSFGLLSVGSTNR